jgi:hypothetical protein
MEVEMMREDVLALGQLSAELLNPRFGSLHPKFAYAVSKNFNGCLKQEGIDFQVATERDEEWQAYEKERLELARELCQKDADGSPVVVSGGQFIIPNQISFNEQLAVIQKKYAAAVKRREESLKEVLTFDMYKIKLSHIPEKMAGPVTMYMSAFIVDDEEESK